MLKFKILSILLCILLILIPFTLTASASEATDAVDTGIWIIDYIYDCYTSSNRLSDMDTEDFREYVFSGEYLKDNSSIIRSLPSVATVELKSSLKGMQDSYYASMKLNKEQLRQLQNFGNAAVSGYGKTVNYSSFNDLNLQTYGGVRTNGIITQGSGGPVFYMDSNFDWSRCKQFYYFQTLNNDISVFSGSSNAFPIIYVPKDASLYQNGNKLPSDYVYVPIGNNELLRVSYYWTGLQNFPYMTCGFTSSDSLDSVEVRFAFGNLSSSGLFSSSCMSSADMSIYRDGLAVGYIGDGTYTAAGIVDRLEKMVGTRINYDGKPTIEPFELPSDIPYDDNDEVVVCVPMGDGNSGEVVYLSPTEYNNYINNGDIIQNDNRVSDFHDEQTIQNISNVVNNITNNYGGSYDDTNLLNKLENWFGDVNKNLKKIVDRLDTLIDTVDSLSNEPLYTDFSECFYDNVPAAADFKKLFKDLDDATKSIDPNNGEASENSEKISYSIPFYNPFSRESINVEVINFDWYEPYRENIRNLFGVLAYVLGAFGIWSSIKSVFGIHAGGDD